jgi:hypothetical protein
MSSSIDKVVSIVFLFNHIVLAGLRVRSPPLGYRARKLTIGLRIPGVLIINFHRRIVSFSETSSYILRMVGRQC